LDLQASEVAAGDVRIQPLVSLSPNQADGILEAVAEEDVDLLLIEWRGSEGPEPIQELDRLLRTAPTELAIIHLPGD